MDGKFKQTLRHDISGCFNSIRLSLEVIRGSDNRAEADSFLDRIDAEMAKVEWLVEGAIADAPAEPPRPISTYQFIPLTDQP